VSDRHPYQLVATDLDGTLLLDDLTVSGRTRQVLADLASQGVVHLVVTGRPASGCQEIFTAMGYQALAVCGQGAQLYDAGSGELIETRDVDLGLARSAVEMLSEKLPEASFAVLTSGLDGRLVVGNGFGYPSEMDCYPRYPLIGLWGRPIERVLVRHGGLPDDELAAVVAGVCAGQLDVLLSAPGQVELVPCGIDKGIGLARAAAILGVDPVRTVAFGDMPNDIPMLRWSGYGVAMGNAHPDLVAVAAEVAPSNADDGVARVLERVFHLGGRP
jgi:hydroxymethylpyrimidine pyrophosphatase-like HAD family hydrolase